MFCILSRVRGASRVIRALCDFRPPYGIRELAMRSNTPAPTITRVVQLLEQEDLLQRILLARLQMSNGIRFSYAGLRTITLLPRITPKPFWSRVASMHSCASSKKLTGPML